MLKEIRKVNFLNGTVYALETEDGHPIEVTDTFLPYYTKFSEQRKTNILSDYDITDRSERWMIGVSCMSGCPVGCKFCATGSLDKWRSLTCEEIVEQVEFILAKHEDIDFCDSKEHKINYTRMGEPFLNIDEFKKAVEVLDKRYPNTNHFISTIGIKGSDFSWIKNNLNLQLSLHSLDSDRRDWLIPYSQKMSIEELGKVRCGSNRKITLNMTLVDALDFDIDELQKHFDKEEFFIKLSPINPNECSVNNNVGEGVIGEKNII